MMKKFVSLLLVVMMAIVPFAGNAATFTPGESTGTATGFGGDVTVKVTVDENAVTAVEITGEKETPALGGAAIEKYAPQQLRSCEVRMSVHIPESPL